MQEVGGTRKSLPSTTPSTSQCGSALAGAAGSPGRERSWMDKARGLPSQDFKRKKKALSNFFSEEAHRVKGFLLCPFGDSDSGKHPFSPWLLPAWILRGETEHGTFGHMQG